ncbi:MAG: choice-of-anchor J domain-containing protein [Bacteroides sp.]
MNKNIVSSLLVALLMTGCSYNNENFEGLVKGDKPTDLKKVEVEFTEYATLKGDAKKNGYFSEADPATNYLPAWLAKNYFTADEGSSAKVTFKFKENISAFAKAYASIDYLKLSNDDYKLVHGAGYYGSYLNKYTTSKLYKVLKAKYEAPAVGNIVLAEYNYNADAKPQKMDDPLYSFDFENLQPGEITRGFNGWFVQTTGGINWQAKSYSDNTYPQFSANGAKGAVEGWLVTPKVKVTNEPINLTFDVNVGYYNADCLSVLISTDFNKDVAKATWKDVTSSFTLPKVPTSGYGTFASAGILNLTDYAGKSISVAFKYVGNGVKGPDLKTTTYQIDNVIVGKDIPVLVKTEPQYALMEYTEKGWNAVSNADVIALSPSDYTAMGDPGKNFNFSASIKAADYLPAFLNKAVAYPLNKEAKVIVYKYYNGKTVEAYGDEYIYSSETARWAIDTHLLTKTEQYVLSAGNWNFDPSTVIALGGKGDAATSAFYQFITDYVKAEKGAQYVSSFGNNDYYYGGSAYQNNFDFRPSAWKAQASEYASMDDTALKELMFNRLPEAFLPALKQFYADANLVPGVEVIYTVTFFIYFEDKTTVPYAIKYKVTGLGQFEYIKDSLAKIVV